MDINLQSKIMTLNDKILYDKVWFYMRKKKKKKKLPTNITVRFELSTRSIFSIFVFQKGGSDNLIETSKEKVCPFWESPITSGYNTQAPYLPRREGPLRRIVTSEVPPVKVVLDVRTPKRILKHEVLVTSSRPRGHEEGRNGGRKK